MITRDTIFISHATLGESERGLDNDFSQWLALRLIGMGYKVWCDLKNLKGGEDFWEEIENEIRNKAIKYLYVLSSNSNHRKGTLKELAVAEKIKKQLGDAHFIIPLHIDKNFSHDDINIDLVRLNSINFKNGWSSGLANLIERLIEDGVPQPEKSNYEAVCDIWQDVLLGDRKAIEKPETYASNWFPITHLPEFLYFHKVDDLVRLHEFPLWTCDFPTTKYKQYLVSFAQQNEFANVIPQFESYDSGRTKIYRVSEVMQEEFDDDFIKGENAKRIIIRLLNLTLNRLFVSKGLRKYQMSNERKAFWLPLGALEKDKVNKILMVGKMKYGKEGHINWHFGVSGSARIEADIYFVISSHIIFTENGKKLIMEDSIQHRCRRKQGKGWWNRHWRDKLLNFMGYFAQDDGMIRINVGNSESVLISRNPFNFQSPFGYVEPNEKNLPEESDDIESIEDADEGIETESEGDVVE